MIVATGKSILKGIAIGKIRFLAKKQAEIKDTAADPAVEMKRYEDAKALATEQLQGLYDKAVVEAGEDHAAIFEIHMILRASQPNTPSKQRETILPRPSPPWTTNI